MCRFEIAFSGCIWSKLFVCFCYNRHQLLLLLLLFYRVIYFYQYLMFLTISSILIKLVYNSESLKHTTYNIAKNFELIFVLVEHFFLLQIFSLIFSRIFNKYANCTAKLLFLSHSECCLLNLSTKQYSIFVDGMLTLKIEINVNFLFSVIFFYPFAISFSWFFVLFFIFQLLLHLECSNYDRFFFVFNVWANYLEYYFMAHIGGRDEPIPYQQPHPLLNNLTERKEKQNTTNLSHRSKAI